MITTVGQSQFNKVATEFASTIKIFSQGPLNALAIRKAHLLLEKIAKAAISQGFQPKNVVYQGYQSSSFSNHKERVGCGQLLIKTDLFGDTLKINTIIDAVDFGAFSVEVDSETPVFTATSGSKQAAIREAFIQAKQFAEVLADASDQTLGKAIETMILGEEARSSYFPGDSVWNYREFSGIVNAHAMKSGHIVGSAGSLAGGIEEPCPLEAGEAIKTVDVRVGVKFLVEPKF
ncbi:MAG: SIMPL domain-containing protein [Alphaproteobacteria bacterium]